MMTVRRTGTCVFVTSLVSFSRTVLPGCVGQKLNCGGLRSEWASLVAQTVKNTCSAGDPGLIPGSGRSAGEEIGDPLQHSWASPVAQLVKHPSAMWETLVRYLEWEDSLEKGKATHSSVLACRIPWTEELVGCSPWSRTESDTTEQL